MSTTGVLGRRWRATVTPWGAVEPWDGSATLDWFVAADDRWYVPSQESTVRQSRQGGMPVIETRLRIPKGDAVHRVYSVADDGGMTVVEITNESPLPIAVALTRRDLLTARPPSAVPVQGIDLPTDAIVVPVGHAASATVVLRHVGAVAGPLPEALPPAAQVERGWATLVDRASRVVLPDDSLSAGIAAARCELALAGPPFPDTDPAGFLIAVGQLVRMGERAEPWLDDVAAAVESMARSSGAAWRVDAAFDAVDLVLRSADESRAARDLDKVRARWMRSVDHIVTPPSAPDDPVDLLAWLDRWCVSRGGELLPLGVPRAWWGAPVEVYDAQAGGSRVSFALRWHGERPAVLWETTGDPIRLTAPVMAPDWHTADQLGEALWPAVEASSEGFQVDDEYPHPPTRPGEGDAGGDGVSFS